MTAQIMGIRTSAIRYWEERGLLNPQRDSQNKYRLYDEEQILRLRIVVLLREVHYEFDAIHSILAEVAIGQIDLAVKAAEKRLHDLLIESERCSAATAATWNYIKEVQSSKQDHKTGTASIWQHLQEFQDLQQGYSCSEEII